MYEYKISYGFIALMSRREVGSSFPVLVEILDIYSAILGTKVELFTALQQFFKPPFKK